jgi:REP element-mobilizing transposase RayT
MPIASDFPYPRRYNSLRLLGFDYANTTALFFITMLAENGRPIFADFTLAKSILATLLDPRTTARIRIHAYTLLPDHFHLLAGVRDADKKLSVSLGLFKSYTTQKYWKRGHDLAEGESIAPAPIDFGTRSEKETKQLLQSIIEWRATLRPEAIKLKKWPKVRTEFFLAKRLWQTRFHEHIIRNDADLRETIEYIAMNPVKRGYVSRPQYYPFTAFNFCEEEF